MTIQLRALLLGMAVITVLIFSGCETSADIELKRAEKAINEAQAVGADATASEDFSSAEQLLSEAQELARSNKILEARQTAIEAKVRADDAKTKALEQAKILDDEAQKLGK